MDNGNHILLLLLAQRLSLRNIMPLSKATTTAGRRGMLGDKHRVAAHRCLLAIIDRYRRGKPLRHKIGCMPVDNLRTFIPTILSLFCSPDENGNETVSATGEQKVDQT